MPGRRVGHAWDSMFTKYTRFYIDDIALFFLCWMRKISGRRVGHAWDSMSTKYTRFLYPLSNEICSTFLSVGLPYPKVCYHQAFNIFSCSYDLILPTADLFRF